jgi:hypothetical protein
VNAKFGVNRKLKKSFKCKSEIIPKLKPVELAGLIVNKESLFVRGGFFLFTIKLFEFIPIRKPKWTLLFSNLGRFLVCSFPL